MKTRIPKELREIPQWVCAGANKIPLNPNNGLMASPTNPNTWGTFDAAIASGMKYVGFVLTNSDPYCVIDLDVKDNTPKEDLELHGRIISAFATYAERSASGKGTHIVLRGRVPTGARRGSVEIYSNERYIIFTGDVVKDLPISDCNDLANVLYGEMQAGKTKQVDLVEFDEQLSDIEIYEMAVNAENGSKFYKLASGDWSGYPSQSEADFALLAILGFYSKSNEQVRRMFRMSGLGKRDKATRNDDYLNRALSKIRSHEPPPVDLDKLALPSVTKTPAPEPAVTSVPTVIASAPVQVEEPVQSSYEFPPGLVGDIAEYIYTSAVRPVREIALAGALALVAGICGRSYNVSGTGLNLYIILLAATGSGKEGAGRGIDNLLASVKSTVPASDMFIGPSAFASGQSLVRVLNDKPCFVSVLGEFGLLLQQMCDPRANAALVMLKKVLLDIFAKSGNNQMLRSTVYADIEKNTKIIQAPNVTILGESTPDTFFGGLDSSHIAEGLIPRFSVIHYTGKRPKRNRNANNPPNQILVSKFTDLLNIALTTFANNSCAHVQMTQAAMDILDEFDAHCDERINGSGSDIEHQLWNRAHLKALKLAGVIAVGCEPYAPVINERHAQWAIQFVRNDVNTMVAKFKKGDVGTGESKQEADIRRAVEDYLTMSTSKRLDYGITKAMAEVNVIPFPYLRRRLRLLASFKADPRGPAKALDEAIRDMVKAEILQQVPPIQVQQRFGSRTEVYTVGSSW